MKCELCAGPLDEPHGHAVDTFERRLLCACYACTLLFAAPNAARGRFKIVPQRYAALDHPLFTDAQWEALGIPIGLAFFFENSASGEVSAFYPGPAGATESLLPLEHWRELKEREPLLASMVPDVEAALVYRRKEAQTRTFVVPIDACYELAGIVRTCWKGIGGGDDVHRKIDDFFARIAQRPGAGLERVR
ncbi:MAG: DUF5947 family protein [Candidatus Baltobacteraceae bacterium]